MARSHDRARYGAVHTAIALTRSLVAMTREPMPTPRHARRETPWSTR
jgi:hypothetical protein